MQYYSTNGKAALADLRTVVTRGLAEDRGLYMPQTIKKLPQEFFDHIGEMSFQQVACSVADAFFGEDVPSEVLHRIVCETLAFDCPIKEVRPGVWSLELFHGPTLAFKDVGARFMARLLQYFTAGEKRQLNVLVATSGDTGSAVANGFLDVEGIIVHVLYPKGKVSPIQECQFATLGRNVRALEMDGVFDDCQALVKNAFMDSELKEHVLITSANSINVARFLPQSFYYFWAYAQLRRAGKLDHGEKFVVCVPSGNFGNICSAMFAKKMGLPVERFIAANNSNDVFFQFLKTGEYSPKPSVQTIANAMDVGDPSNFARVWELYGKSVDAVRADVSGYVMSDPEIRKTMAECWKSFGYLLDPHGACAYKALSESLQPGEVGVFCETAHPAKFKDTVEGAIGAPVAVPAKLQAFMNGEKKSIPMGKDYESFRKYLMSL